MFRALVIGAHFVGKAGIGIDADQRIGDVRDLIDRRPKLFRAKGAVEPEGKRLQVLHRVPEGLGRLAGEVASRKIGDRAGHHDWQFDAELVEHLLDGKARRLGIQRVEDGLD